ncbi:B-type flagellin [Botrimarina colliarenosi]|uniref:Flagellin n=1 Tax=Botrimarina colliarenosi TaxID=2528001 RepID=A0A5C6AI99_9BACT|nr:flagellin [Botrimarina colliarenosi]TWT99359.1 B-type flagellin [Botrimarina colliarenosi]
MTRINTNVSSLIGRNNLQKANSSLSQSLTRLSTGLRINTGKDDPAGLIASENLRSDITSIKKAITNTDRANQVIATADSALGQVSSLLNDIRGLVTESANAGALSDEQIAANQLQVDSSLEALNRIAQTTTFQGRRLLDGSLDFLTSAGSEFGKLSNLKIDQANLGSTGEVSVDIAVASAAKKASVEVGGIELGVPGVNSTGTISFQDTAVAATGTAQFEVETSAAVAGTGTANVQVETADSIQGIADLNITGQATGTLTFGVTGSEALTITALEGGAAGGDASITVTFVDAATSPGAVNSAVYNGTDTITVTADFASGTLTSQEVATAIAGISAGADFAVSGGSATNLVAGDATGPYTNVATGGGLQGIELTAITDTDADGAEFSTGNGPLVTVTLGVADPSSSADYNATTNTLAVRLTQAAGTATLADVAAAISAGGEFTVDTSGVTNTASTIGSTAAGAAAFSAFATDGVDPTFDTETFDITSVAGGNQDFNLQILSAASASIVDADATDGVVASITGDATTGYTVTVANDANTNLAALAQFVEDQIAEAASVSYSGSGSDVYNPTKSGDALPTPLNVTGSFAAVTQTRSLEISVDPATFGANPNLSFSFVNGPIADAGATKALAVETADGYQVTIDDDGDSGAITFQDIADALETVTGITVTGTVGDLAATYNPSGVSEVDASTGDVALTNGFVDGADVITITADTADAEFDGTVTFATSSSVTAGSIGVTIDSDNNITVTVDDTSTYNIADIATAITNKSGYTASVTTAEGSGTFSAANLSDDTTPTVEDLAGGQAKTGGLLKDAVIQLAGSAGSEVFNLKAGTDIDTLVQQINLISDATGVAAEVAPDGTTLQINSTGYGSSAFVDLQVSQEDAGTFTAAVGSGSRAAGTDVVATVNGIAATGDGNSLSINTATLDLSTSVEADFVGTSSFTITGGGALFQLGPDVVSNQQARLGISSVNTAALGGVSGKLYQLGSGGTADLANDPTTAARIVNEAIDQVTSLRGRLGAFQRTSLETNKNALNDTLSNLTEAESSIRDADFAEETANLTRSQILVQSGTRVLAIANQNPQNVLGLLG